MSEQTIRDLQQLLGAGDDEVGFLTHMPESAAEMLLHASRETLEAEDTAVVNAIAGAVEALPAPFDRVARVILG